MKKELFINAVQQLLPNADTEGVNRWIEFAEENVSSEQYVDFESKSIPADDQIEIERWLESLFAGLYHVKQTYSIEIAEKLWECGVHQSCLYPYEMVPMAKHLIKGGEIEDVEELINKGMLEDDTLPFFLKMDDVLPAESPYLDLEAAENKAHLSSDLACGTRQLFELEKELQGKEGAFCKWLRAAYEINDDFAQPLAKVIDDICTAFKESYQLYGRTPTLQIYNSQAVVLPHEIKSASQYLYLGGRFDSISDLAKNGFFEMENNKILELASQIRRLTYGMCRVGPGPYGFGVSNHNPANIIIALDSTPDPMEDEILSPEAKEIKVTVKGYFNNNLKEKLDEDTILRLSKDDNPSTRIVAAALKELSQVPIMVSANEWNTAFCTMAEYEIENMGNNGLTKTEAQQIADTCWYEGKSAEEIVEFQLYEPLLCMPFKKFKEAIETVLGRPVYTHEFANKSEIQEEYRMVKQLKKADAFYCQNESLTQQMENGTENDAEIEPSGLNM